MIASRTSLEGLRAALLDLPPKLRRRPLRNSLAAGARVVRDGIKPAVPVLDTANPGSVKALRRGVRKPGTVRDAVRVRTSKLVRRAGDVGVFVNVRPLPGGGRGTNNPNDPYYWYWLDRGWTTRGGRRMPGLGFTQRGVAQLDAALQAFTARIGPEIARLNVRRSEE
jgi:hypothetical protein